MRKKGHEGTLRQALAARRLASNSIVRSLAQKKKTCGLSHPEDENFASITPSSSFPLSSLFSLFSNDEVEVGVNQLVPPIIC